MLILADVMDIYIDKSKRVWIIDFNIFGHPTNSLLFTWEELTQSISKSENIDSDVNISSILRVVESSVDTLSSDTGMSRGPVETTELAFRDFSEFMKVCKAQNKRHDDDSSIDSNEET